MQHIMHEKGRVDVLVNNAGYGLMCPIEDASMQAIHAQFDVNVFACVKLMQLVTPVMREQNFGLIINMSSVVGHVSMPLIGFYAASKHALEAISDSARNELYKFGIHVVLVEPGAIQTEFEDVAFSQMDKAIQTDVYKPLAQKLKKLSNMKYARAPKAAAVANVVQKIATTNKPKKRYKVGLDAHFMIPVKNILGDNIIDPILRFLLRTK